MKALLRILAVAHCVTLTFASDFAVQVVQRELDGGGGFALGGRYSNQASLSSTALGESSGGSGRMIAFNGFVGSLNDPPRPSSDVLTLPTNAASVSIIDLLQNDSDTEGEQLTLELLSTNTLYGGIVVISQGVLTYTPPAIPPPEGTDEVEYLLSDEAGGAQVGTLIWSSQDFGASLVTAESIAKELKLTFRGVADVEYKLQFRPDLSQSSTWANVNVVAPSGVDGLHQFTVSIDGPQGYYRSVQNRAFRSVGIFAQGGQVRMTFRVALGSNWRLQSRSSFQSDSRWQDYPNPRQPLRASTDFDDTVTFFAPKQDTSQFFRAAREN